MARIRIAFVRAAFALLPFGCDAPEDRNPPPELVIAEASMPAPRIGVAQEYTQVMQRVLDASPVRLEITQGEIQWESEIQPGVSGGAWLVADVNAAASCGGPREARVRVRYHSELPHLQPTATSSLLLIGRVAEAGVVEVESVVQWGHDGSVVTPDRRIAYPLAREMVMHGC